MNLVISQILCFLCQILFSSYFLVIIEMNVFEMFSDKEEQYIVESHYQNHYKLSKFVSHAIMKYNYQ